MTILTILAAVVLGFFALIIGLRVLMVYRARSQQGRPAPQLAGKPGKHVARGDRALFYFYSPSCGACQAMTPVVQKLAKRNKGVFPVDISRDMDTARKFSVMATPTTVIVGSGKIEQVLIGPQPPTTLEALAGAA